MKAFASFALLVGLLVAGCSTVTPGVFRERIARYEEIHSGMTRAEIVARVGNPGTTAENGRAVWTTESPFTNEMAQLAVDFDAREVARGVNWHVSKMPPPPREQPQQAMRVQTTTFSTGETEEKVMPYSQGALRATSP
jgi:outer membrane protein assembly factor BamE (lipoprotein component of BamABCDE complex)